MEKAGGEGQRITGTNKSRGGSRVFKGGEGLSIPVGRRGGAGRKCGRRADGILGTGEPQSGEGRGCRGGLKSEMDRRVTLEGLQLFNRAKLSLERQREGRKNQDQVASPKLRWTRGFQNVGGTGGAGTAVVSAHLSRG